MKTNQTKLPPLPSPNNSSGVSSKMMTKKKVKSLLKTPSPYRHNSSPHFSPMSSSPMSLPTFRLTPSSPTPGTIVSVIQRVSQLQSERASTMQNVSRICRPLSTSNLPSYDNNGRDSAAVKIDKYIARHRTLKSMEADMIINGKIVNKTKDTLTIRVSQIYKPHEYEPFIKNIYSYNIFGTCHISEIDSIDKSYIDMTQQFQLGETVKALVISIDVHGDVLFLSMNNSRLSTTQHHLGCISSSDSNHMFSPSIKQSPYGQPSTSMSPSYSYLLSPRHAQNFTMSTYNNVVNVDDDSENVIEDSMGYGSLMASNLANITHANTNRKTKSNKKQKILNTTTASSNNNNFGNNQNDNDSNNYSNNNNNNNIPVPPPPPMPFSRNVQKSSIPFFKTVQKKSLFLNCEGPKIMGKAYGILQYGSLLKSFKTRKYHYQALRVEQNQAWAVTSVTKGINSLNNKDYNKAQKWFNNAIDLDSSLVETYVAMGKLYYEIEHYDKALEYLDHAEDLVPNHPNALRYRNLICKKRKHVSEETDNDVPNLKRKRNEN